MVSASSFDGAITSSPTMTTSQSNLVAPMEFHSNILPQIAPQVSRYTIGHLKSQAHNFQCIFGRLGLPMVVIACICITWTSLLVVITIRPNEMANMIMNTGSFDEGQFWLIVDPPFEIKYLGVAGMILVDIGYAAALLKLLTAAQFNPSLGKATITPEKIGVEDERRLDKRRSTILQAYRFASGSWSDLTSITGKNRKIWNLLWKVMDLVVQSIQLVQVLESGFPVMLVRTYSVFLFCNALSCVFTILSARHSALAEILVDSIFDLFAAVIYPIIVLVYCYHNFDFDRELFQLYLDILLPGSFERLARMIADPSEIVFFLNGFDSLRILTVGNLLLRIGMNLSFCDRFYSVIDAQIRECRIKHLQKSPAKHHPRSSRSSIIIANQRHVPKVFAAGFALLAAFVIVWSEKALKSSSRACAAYPQCVVYAHRWRNSESCPCLTLIDVDESPLTMDDWLHAPDVTETVRELSASGDLQVLQLINHGLPKWPDELRRCKNLRYVSLMYSGLEELPEWAKELSQLQYLHLEGKEMFSNIKRMDPNLFSNMPNLVFLHIGVHDEMSELPPFDGVPRLRSLVLAHMFALKRVPSLSRLPKLQRLELPFLPALEVLPDLTSLSELVHFAAFRAAHYCCNGFFGACDLSDPFCEANQDINVPKAYCIADSRSVNKGTIEALSHFPGNYCARDNGFDRKGASNFINPEIVGVCGGIRFKQCEYPVGSGQLGICFNNRMQVLTCVVNPQYFTLRRAQIAKKIGLPCNPDIEQWLGCQPAT